MAINRRLFIGALAASAGATYAQTPPFPSKPITIILPFAAGSGGDQHMRVLTTVAADILKVPVIINNLPGGNGAVAYNTLRNTAPDGHTVMLTTSTTQVINPILMAKPPFDPGRDLKAVAGMTKLYQVMIVRPDFPAAKLQDFVVRAKAQPGKLTFGSGTSASRLGAELFASLVGIDMLHVAYKATPNAVTDVAAGVVDMMFADLPVALGMIQSGRVRPLAVGSPERLSALPDVPTLVEAGVAGYEYSAWSGLYVLPATPDDIVARLHEVFSLANRSPAAEKFRATASLEKFEATPAQLARFQANDLTRWKALAAKLGIKPE
jgi:tripartite-type tricarboxylate transporter receptor subunit TctC